MDLKHIKVNFFIITFIIKIMKKILIIDGNSLAYSRIPDEDKTPKDALYSSIDNRNIFIVRKFMKKILRYKYVMFPGYELVVVFDQQNKETFRHEMSDKYKAKKLSPKRQEQKDYVYNQIDEIKKVLNTIGIPNYSTKYWEADDVIGMMVDYLEKNKYLSTIVSGDKDILQLISSKTRVLYLDNTHKMINTDRNNVWDISGGVWPDQVIEMKMLAGDSSDNIKGIGLLRNGKVDYWTDTEAKDLIKKYNTIENAMKNIDQVQDPFKKSLIKGQEKLMFNKKLVTIVREWKLDDIEPSYFTKPNITQMGINKVLEDLNLQKLLVNKRFKSNFMKEKE